jgi:DNA-binding NarL/FixJ family response regulator
MNHTPIKVIIAESYPLFRLALCQTLQTNAQFVISSLVENLQDLEGEIRKDPSNIILIDSLMIEGCSKNYCSELKKQFSNLSILLLSADTHGLTLKNILKNIDGFVLKTIESEELLNALTQISKGERYIQLSVRMKLSDWIWASPSKKQVALTSREKEVLQMIVDEFTSKEIAEKLFISQCTADTHRLSIIQKMGVKNTAGLVREAIKQRLYLPSAI